MIKKIVSSILFPKNPLIQTLEALTPQKLRSSIPPSPHQNAVLTYQHPLTKALIRGIKFTHHSPSIALGGALLHHHICTHYKGEYPVLLIPVPQSLKRRLQRGYDHTLLLAKAIIAHDHSRHLRLLCHAVHRTHRPPQSTKKRADRLTSLTHSFMAHSAVVKNTHIIIIDDVCTTGATIAEMKRALREAGALSVTAFTLAH